MSTNRPTGKEPGHTVTNVDPQIDLSTYKDLNPYKHFNGLTYIFDRKS